MIYRTKAEVTGWSLLSPKLKINDPAFERLIYQFVSEGQKTAVSNLPSPSNVVSSEPSAL
jgi:hypothetical protein